MIKTPDQRVRVFISSTINELADERKAAREAIEALRLIPVFFEAGARPHPPRDLYSAYLEQSHIFLGIYWNSYGWVAPGAEISGLEDEYRLCGNSKPKLMYVKRSEERQPRLNDLLADIESSESACYQFFNDATELRTLIENDLSVLISETFEKALFQSGVDHEFSGGASAAGVQRKHVELPLIKSELIGRSDDISRLTEMLRRKDASLITLLGAGGTGKTTLSIHIARQLQNDYRDGLVFVPLAPVTEVRQVVSVIAELLGVTDSGKQPLEQSIIDFLVDKNYLLILDNFEQVIEASKFVSDLINHCGEVNIIVTSRTSLHIRNERIYNLAPLALPGESAVVSPDELKDYPATCLFVERALEVNPSLAFTPENTEAIIEICQRMDGLPLAIELAAARTRFFQPAAMMARLQKTLDLVNKGHKDLPERQQTLRAAIEWSYNLLSTDTQRVFRQLGVFKRSWTLESADLIINGAGQSIDIEEMTERLLDVSLIKPVLLSHASEPRFNMLQTVHEYAAEMLESSPEAEETAARYADYFCDLILAAEPHLWGINSDPWLDKMEFEYQNIRASYRILTDQGKLERAWQMLSVMASYWTLRGGFSEIDDWIVSSKLDDPGFLKLSGLNQKVLAKAVVWAGYCKLFLFDFQNGFEMMNRAEEIAIANNDDYALMYGYLFDGCYGSFMYREDSVPKMLRALELAEQQNNRLALSMFYCWSYEYYRQQGRMDIVQDYLGRARKIATEDGNTYILGAVYLLESTLSMMDPEVDWQALEEKSREMYQIFPEKGYRALKGAAMSGIGYALIMQGKLDEAEAPLIKGFEYARMAGEIESLIYAVMEGSHFFRLKGNDQKAYTLFGALDQFVAVSGYPLTGGSEMQYNLAKQLLDPDFHLNQNKNWYETGKNMRLEDAVVFALKAS